MALVALCMAVQRILMGRPVVIDPTREADIRAKEEAEARADKLRREKNRLALELALMTVERDKLLKQLEQRQAAQVQELRNNPEVLRQAMIEAGKPSRK